MTGVSIEELAAHGRRAAVQWFNAAFVLLLPHQLGHFLGDGSLARVPRRGVPGMVVAARCGLSLLLTDLPSSAGPRARRLIAHVDRTYCSEERVSEPTRE
jgi:hypothetical protein